MVFTVRDIELLKMICWCKNIPGTAGNSFVNLYTDNDINDLKYKGLIVKSKDGRMIRPRPIAYHLLEYIGYYFQSDNKVQSDKSLLSRRKVAAEILFTFYMAGIDVFVDKLDHSIQEPVYMASFAARRNDINKSYGSTRFYGIFCTPQKAFLVLHIESKDIYTQNEMTLFNNLIERTGIQNTAIIFMGNSTANVASTVFGSSQKTKTKVRNKKSSDPFSQLFQKISLPVHFIPTGDAGAQILKFLQMPNYRETIARIVMQGRYKPPYEDMPDTDTVHYEQPFSPIVIAIDMDVKRIDRALATAQQHGFERIAIFVLMEQVPFIKARYGDTGNADISVIQIESLKQVFNDGQLDLYSPPNEPYITQEGGYIDAANISDYRKVRKQDL